MPITSIGVMQGRLTPGEPRVAQIFPSDWRAEFSEASTLGFDHLEWLFDENTSRTNPAFLCPDEVKAETLKSGVSVRTSCLHFMLSTEFHSQPISHQHHRVAEAAVASAEVGADLTVLPFETPIRTESDIIPIVSWLEGLISVFPNLAGLISLELNVTSSSARAVDARISQIEAGVTIDTGNLARMAQNPIEVMSGLQNSLRSAHLKDIDSFGNSVPIGKGLVNFSEVMAVLTDSNLNLAATLEIPRAIGDNSEQKEQLDKIASLVSPTQKVLNEIIRN